MLILAIDPGTNCGWCLREASGRMTSGVWDLAPKRHEGAGMRLIRLRTYLAEIAKAGLPAMVAYEEVRRHAGTTAAHVYGEIVGKIREWCEDNKVPYVGVPVATVKRTATGKGNADKEAMIDAALRKWPRTNDCDFQRYDDNEADARWIAEAAWAAYGAGARTQP